MNAKGAILALALVLLMSSVGLFPRAAAQDETGALGGDLIVALQDFRDVDPTLAAPADRKVLELVYDSLGRIDPVTLQFVPWAATGWEWDVQKNITVTLRDDLHFHDGSAYDADAVVRSMNTYTKSGTQRWNVVKVDELTVRFDFTAINATTWSYRTNNQAGSGLFYTEGLSAFIAWDAAGVPKYSGPFQVASETATQLRLTPNPNHFLGRPYLDSITYQWPYTLAFSASNTTVSNDGGCALMFQQVHLIGWPLLTNDLTNTRDCVAGFGGFGPDDPLTIGVNESLRALLNPDARQSMPFVLTAKNPGTDFLYFGFSYNAGSFFVGAPNTAGQRLRSAIYQFVNKGLYRDIEPNSLITHGLQNQFNAPWAPLTCAPWLPCNTVVEANTVPAPAPVIRKTDTTPGIVALNNAGFFDRNGDGLRETSTGQPVAFTILAPSFGFDPRKTTIASDMEAQLRSAQLDVTVQAYDTQAALDAAITACSTNCMYVKRFTGAAQLPDWMYDMAEIRAAGDTAADLHLNLGAATAFTYDVRSLHVGHVSHLVGAAADILPVLHFDNLEAFDFESFGGWVNTFGGINNFWSLSGLRLPALGALHPTVTVFPRGLGPGETGAVQVEVRDAVGNLVPAAEVWLSAGQAGALQATQGTTDASGLFRTTYVAPTVTGTVDDTIWATATKVQYTGGRSSTSLAIHPAAAESLVVSVSRGADLHEIAWNETATVWVNVTDDLGNGIANAEVTLRTDLPGGVFAAASGTTSNAGTFSTTFSAPDAKQGMTYQIFAEVSEDGYDLVTASTSLQVTGNEGTVEPIITTRNVPGFEAAAAIGAVALVFALVAMARRRED